LRLIKDVYFDFNLDHAREMIAKNHNIKVSYPTLYRWAKAEGLGKRKKRRPSRKRMRRERFANEGLLLQMDGSRHKWFGEKETGRQYLRRRALPA